MSDAGPGRVLIAGGGIAALEALLALRHLAGGRFEIDVIAPTDEFAYRPFTVLEPFRGESLKSRIKLRNILRDHDAGHVFDAVESVDPKRQVVRTASGEDFGYGTLILATGAHPRSALTGH